jgi:hypothetical protein
MKQVNELSPQLALRAQQAALQKRSGPGSSQMSNKFGSYAQKKISANPQLKFQLQSGPDSGAISGQVVQTPTGPSLPVRLANGQDFKLVVSTNTKPYRVSLWSAGLGHRPIIGFDRSSAVQLAKALGMKPQDFPMSGKQSPEPESPPAIKMPSQNPEYTIENLMKEDLKVQRFSLKQIVENLDKIQEKTGKFGEPSNNLSQPEKKKMLEMLGRFGKHGQALRGDGAIREAAKELSELATMAKKYAMNENNSDFIQKETVQRDFKQMDGIVKEFQKLAQECVNSQMQLAALYEDYGNVMERYYSMESINETGNTQIPEDVQTNLGMSECGTCGCGNPGNTHKTDTETTPTAMLSQEEEQDEYASGF